MRACLFLLLVACSSSPAITETPSAPAQASTQIGAQPQSDTPSEARAVAPESVIGTEPPPPIVPAEPPVPPPLPPANVSAATSSSARPIRIHFMGADEPFRDCVAHPSVQRTVPAGTDPIAFAVRSLVSGPTTVEKEGGLWSPLTKSVSEPTTPAITEKQLDVTLKNGVATVHFDPAIQSFLNQAICARTSVTSVIERTLLQFKEVKEVQFAIGKEEITEWDA